MARVSLATSCQPNLELRVECADLKIFLEHPGNSALRRMLHVAPFGASAALDGKIVYANPACARLWGFSRPDEMLGRSLFDFVAPSWREFVATLWAVAREHSEPWTYRLEGSRADGSTFPFEITSVSVETDSGKVTFAFFSAIDMSITPADELDRLRAAHGLELAAE
jgi:PAS domain S-box-containing protein